MLDKIPKDMQNVIAGFCDTQSLLKLRRFNFFKPISDAELQKRKGELYYTFGNGLRELSNLFDFSSVDKIISPKDIDESLPFGSTIYLFKNKHDVENLIFERKRARAIFQTPAIFEVFYTRDPSNLNFQEHPFYIKHYTTLDGFIHEENNYYSVCTVDRKNLLIKKATFENIELYYQEKPKPSDNFTKRFYRI